MFKLIYIFNFNKEISCQFFLSSSRYYSKSGHYDLKKVSFNINIVQWKKQWLECCVFLCFYCVCVCVCVCVLGHVLLFVTS